MENLKSKRFQVAKKLVNSNVRIKSVARRAREHKRDGLDYLTVIASFDTVEQFQAWKNGLSETESYIVQRVGGNNYRKIRDTFEMFGVRGTSQSI